MPMDFINQNVLLIALVVISGLALLWPALVRPAGNTVNPAEATTLINREDAHIVDVRDAEEFASGHLPGELEKFKEMPIIFCCASGMRSNKACAELKKQGFAKLYNLAGGVDAWVGAGYPVKKGARKK